MGAKITGKENAQSVSFNGWMFYMGPEFRGRWQALIKQLGLRRAAGDRAWAQSPEARMLAALVDIIRARIAHDPNHPGFRLKGKIKLWRRVKFFGRYRLFYRFSSTRKVVILTWLSDENSLRHEGSANDPFRLFTGMLTRGEVPDTWDALLASATPIVPALPDARER